MRGVWEERRLFDRRERYSSIFGNRIEGNDDVIDVAIIPDFEPDVEDEQLLSSQEIEFFQEQSEKARQDEKKSGNNKV